MVAAGEDLISHRGYGITMLDVIERAEAPRGSIYYHFPNGKQELAIEVAHKVGREIDVLIDEIDEENEEAVGRSPWDAPEIDGNVFLPGETGLKPGDMVRTRIIAAEDYDLIGEKL